MNDPAEMIKEILASGISQTELANRVKAQSVSCSPSNISRLSRNEYEPGYALGKAIENVFNEISETAGRSSAA